MNVNIHYIQRADGSGNFNEFSDQTPYRLWSDPTRTIPADTARNGYAWAKGVVADMNELLADNPPQWGNYGQVPTPAKKSG